MPQSTSTTMQTLPQPPKKVFWFFIFIFIFIFLKKSPYTRYSLFIVSMASCCVESILLSPNATCQTPQPLRCSAACQHPLRCPAPPKTDRDMSWTSLVIEEAHWQPRAIATTRGNLIASSRPLHPHFSSVGQFGYLYLSSYSAAAVRLSSPVNIRPLLLGHVLATEWSVDYFRVSLN
ncbi:uncharacterized protein IWZ02DRAFT_235561 [Phyllosticta citriasiana]|uniref:uncharacterized protein n=1 Tax=Phyllosticta citriasiana TaxID=595635 RepID=UPI0030FDC5BA